MLAILCDAVRVVDVAAGQKAQDIGHGGLYDRGELPFAENVIAHEVDLPHRRLWPLRHHIDEIDAVFAAADDLRHDIDVVAPDMPVGFDDAADVGLHHGALQRPARLGLDDGCKFGIFYFLVAFERHAVEHGSFDEMHDHPLAGALDRDLVEQTGSQQCFQRRIARGVVEPPVWRRTEIRAHRVGVDAAIVLHGNGAARLRAGLARWRFGFSRGGRRRNKPERCDQQRARRDRPAASPAPRHALAHHIPPVSHSTRCDRIACAGRKNVGGKVSCGLKR